MVGCLSPGVEVRISYGLSDLSVPNLKRFSQLGVDCVDFGSGDSWPGVKEQGFPDLDAVLQARKLIRSYGMDINRVTLPDVTERYFLDQEGGEKDVENTVNALRVFAEAGVPIADETGIKLAMHPSDIPMPDTPFGGIGYHRIIDAFPSKQVGYLYCCGTRAEAGGQPLILDEIHNYGRKGRIFMVHFRNVRGSLATAGAYEEVHLDDGDMNMFRILQALNDVGFDGCINPDHIFAIEGDGEVPYQGIAYSVGYIKALLAALRS